MVATAPLAQSADALAHPYPHARCCFTAWTRGLHMATELPESWTCLYHA